jgi:PPOX class probable F420-dependent enzyme
MSMSREERDAFLRETRIGTLCTLNEDGSPNAMPLWYEWNGEMARMFSSKDTGKVRRLSRDPRACLSVEDPVGATEAWVTVEGTVEIINEGGKEFALKLATIYYKGERREKAVAAWRKKDDWVLLELTPTQIRSI